MRLKISDGDLLIVTFPNGVYKGSETHNVLSESLLSWIRNRGLTNVSITTIHGASEKMQFQVLSVNDVFEEEVLKGAKNG